MLTEPKGCGVFTFTSKIPIGSRFWSSKLKVPAVEKPSNIFKSASQEISKMNVASNQISGAQLSKEIHAKHTFVFENKANSRLNTLTVKRAPLGEWISQSLKLNSKIWTIPKENDEHPHHHFSIWTGHHQFNKRTIQLPKWHIDAARSPRQAKK